MVCGGAEHLDFDLNDDSRTVTRYSGCSGWPCQPEHPIKKSGAGAMTGQRR